MYDLQLCDDLLGAVHHEDLFNLPFVNQSAENADMVFVKGVNEKNEFFVKKNKQ